MTVFTILTGPVPDWFVMSLYNKMQTFRDERIYVYTDSFKDDFVFENLVFQRIDFERVLRDYNFQHGTKLSFSHPTSRGRALKLSDSMRLILCQDNCYYFDTDVFFFKKIEFDYLVYEPVQRRGLNNNNFRLSGENNRFNRILREYCARTNGSADPWGYVYNIFDEFWEDHYPDFGTATVLEIPMIHLGQSAGKKRSLAQDVKYFARYGYFWHCYDKRDFAVVWDVHKQLFPEVYDQALFGELTRAVATHRK